MDARGRARGRRMYGRGRGSQRTGRNPPARDAQFRPIPESEDKKKKRGERFSLSHQSVPSSEPQWSSSVWMARDPPQPDEQNASERPQGSAEVFQGAISLGRATGFSRVPDRALSSSKERMQGLLLQLQEQLRHLEKEGCAVVGLQEGSQASSLPSNTAVASWEPLLAGFRELTMALTAAGEGQNGTLYIDAYEAAADASLLAGNLSFYLACQTRLLSDLYERYPALANRVTEFTGYALLYFGVFLADSGELARLQRAMTKTTLSSCDVRYSLAVVNAFQTQSGAKFLSLFSKGSIRQRTILHSVVGSMKKVGLAELIRAYMSLDRDFTTSRLYLSSHVEFLDLLQEERPDLLPENCENAAEYRFRRSRNR